MEVITMINQKGGVGKTTTAATLACAFADRGMRVLAVDVDRQGNLADCLGNEVDPAKTVSAALADPDESLIKYTVPADANPRVTLLAGDQNLNQTSPFLQSAPGGDRYIKLMLDDVADQFDVCLIDTPPSLEILTQAALTAANWALLVTEADFLALKGIHKTLDTIELLQRTGAAPDLKVLGLLLTQVEKSVRLTAEAKEACKADDIPLLDTQIPKTVRVKEAPPKGKPILYVPGDRYGQAAADSYNRLADEIIVRAGLPGTGIEVAA